VQFLFRFLFKLHLLPINLNPRSSDCPCVDRPQREGSCRRSWSVCEEEVRSVYSQRAHALHCVRVRLNVLIHHRYLPTDLRDKKTRALRRKLSPKDVSSVLPYALSIVCSVCLLSACCRKMRSCCRITRSPLTCYHRPPRSLFVNTRKPSTSPPASELILSSSHQPRACCSQRCRYAVKA
jgi:hypothetical protein